jgi:hypothetical protein
MAGKYNGLIADTRVIIPNGKWTHCCINRESLAARKMPQHLKTMPDEAVTVINFGEDHRLNSLILMSFVNIWVVHMNNCSNIQKYRRSG